MPCRRQTLTGKLKPVFWVLALSEGFLFMRETTPCGLLRVIIGIMWWQQSLWKIPHHYDWGLIHWMEEMVQHASTQLQSVLVRDLVLPNIAVFGPMVYAIERYR